MVKIRNLQLLSSLSILFAELTLIATAHRNSHTRIAHHELERRKNPSTLTLATVTNEATWNGWAGVEKIFSL